MLILAAKPDDLEPAILVAWLTGAGIAILVASLIHMFLLLAACRLTGVRDVSLGRAWTTVLICNVAFYGFLSVMGLGLYVGIQEDSARVMRGNLFFYLSPVNFLYLFAAGVLGHAAIFNTCLGKRDEPAIGFGHASAVAVIYLGMSAVIFSFAYVLQTVARSTVR
ncbi:MAG TPA: hypothetical protein VHR66_04495 [Gemmataceae bacterium]|jgi:hypothetical protein|nr:hypothetical protein [Gemmataceae bacterium]